ncbi:MAG: DNA polymerase III subunit delta, partial [Gemmataceae bacterium]
KPGKALSILAELFREGEDPLAVLGALTAQLRKLSTVSRLLAEGQPLGPALDQAGVPKWPAARQSADKQLRHLGRRRLDLLIDQLIEMNHGLKGGNPLPPKLQLERFVARLAAPREAIETARL